MATEVTSELHDAHVYGTDRSSWAGETVTKQDVFISIVVFGATGDLAEKKTFPCIASLYNRGCATACGASHANPHESDAQALCKQTAKALADRAPSSRAHRAAAQLHQQHRRAARSAGAVQPSADVHLASLHEPVHAASPRPQQACTAHAVSIGTALVRSTGSKC